MDDKAVTAIIGSLVSLLVGAGTLVARLNKQRRAMRLAIAQVGQLGRYYRYARIVPVAASWWAMLVLCLLGLLIALHAVLYLARWGAIPWVPSVLALWPLPPLGVVTIALLAFFDIPTRIILFYLGRTGTIRFEPGYINAKWQLDDPEDFIAMNYDANCCAGLGSRIFDVVLTETSVPADQAPTPSDVSNAEIANYVFFGCIIEHYIGLSFDWDKEKLSGAWKYLASIASTEEKPFQPTNVVSKAPAYIDFLNEIGPKRAVRVQGEISLTPKIKEAVNKSAQWLAQSFSGDASAMATTRFGKASPMALLENLESIDPFSNSDAVGRELLKLSTRMGVWPDMVPGPFLFPYSAGIALLFLNAGCVVVSNEVLRIERDEGFKSLVAAAEERVIHAAYARFCAMRGQQAAEDFSRRIFKRSADQVHEWMFTDYIDVWLFTHCRRNCTVKTSEDKPAPCTLKTDVTSCFCVGPPGKWRREKTSLLKK